MTYSKKKKATRHANCVSLITEERAREIVDKRDGEANALFNIINSVFQFHNGTIKTEANALFNIINSVFQFHNGTIKTV